MALIRPFSTAIANSRLTWTDFFKNRKSRMRWEQLGGSLGGLLGLGGGAAYFLGVADFDPMAPAPLGLPDISMAYFLGIAGVAFVSYMSGTLGANPLWRLTRNPYISLIQNTAQAI